MRIYRYLIAAGFLFLASCQSALPVLSSVSYPKEMPPLAKFESRTLSSNCGVSVIGTVYSVKVYQKNGSFAVGEQWVAWYVKGSEHPYKVMHKVFNTRREDEFWVDKNQDGRPEYYFENVQAFDRQFKGGDCGVLGLPA